MKKLIFGIIGVFFLQLGFIIYTASEATMANIAVPPAIETNGVAADLDAMTAVPDDAIIPTLSLRPRRPNTPNTSHTLFVSSRTTKKGREFGDRPLTASRQTLRLGPQYAGRAQESEPTASIEAPGKRSFIARMIKRPYDWLKAVGSKLK